MSISRRANPKGKLIGYQVLIDRRDPVTGDRNRMVIGTFPTKREAQKAEAKAITERDRGTLLEPDTTTVSMLLDQYLQVELPKTVRPENRQPYESIIKNHLKPALGTVLARKLTVEHVEKLLADMQTAGYSSSLITKTRMRLASALTMGVRWGIVGTNVAELAKAPKIAYKKATILTPDEVQMFIVAAREMAHWPLWLLMVETGARQSELLGLSWDDVDLDAGTLRLGKRVVRLLKGTPITKDGGKSKAAGRTIRLTPGTVKALRRYRKEWLARRLVVGPDWNHDGLLFTTAAGTPLSANNLRRLFDRILVRAFGPAAIEVRDGVSRLTPHVLRKTGITYAVAGSRLPNAVAARVGHADSRVTLDVYAQVTAGMDDALLDVMTAFVPQEHDSATS